MREVLIASVALLAFSCTSSPDNPSSTTTTSTTGTGGAGGQGGSTGGTGGTDPCGGCGGSTPYCDAINGLCEACLEHAHCTDAAAAQCDGGDCVPCSAPEHCAGVADAELCESGTCVECTLDDDDACNATQTCDLLNFTCVDVEAGTLGTCEACTNDSQCGMDHRCVEMNFNQNPHGYYCLEENLGNCDEPFAVLVNRQSINGAATASYCTLEELTASCEAYIALRDGWVCTNNPGFCGPDNQPEVPVAGALCKQVGSLSNRCTYACVTETECLSQGAGSTCGTGSSGSDLYCGG